MGGNLNDSLLYQGLILGFDSCNATGPLRSARLVEAHLRNRDAASFSGRPLSAWSRDQLSTHLAAQGISFQVDQRGGITAASVGLWFTFNAHGYVDEAGIYQTT